MRKLLLAFSLGIAITLFTAVAWGQMAVRTETASNLVKHYSAAVTDTVFVGSGYLYGVNFNTMVADTVTIKDGATTLAVIKLGSTPPAYPISIPFGCKISSSLIIVKSSTGDISIIYRTGY